MKSKEYFKEYQTENQDKSPEWRVIFAFRKMILEVSDIAKMRNVKYDNALRAIFKEQLLKANSFVKMVNETEPFKSKGLVKQDAFKIYIQKTDPELAELVWL
jgi:hypothetical protein